MIRDLLETAVRLVTRHCAVAGSAIVVLTFGMLLWGRLIMTQSVPRTAIARPEARLASSDTPRTPTGRVVIRADLPDVPDRDLFAVRLDLYGGD